MLNCCMSAFCAHPIFEGLLALSLEGNRAATGRPTGKYLLVQCRGEDAAFVPLRHSAIATMTLTLMAPTTGKGRKCYLPPPNVTFSWLAYNLRREQYFRRALEALNAGEALCTLPGLATRARKHACTPARTVKWMHTD